jgi:hypothetical protein
VAVAANAASINAPITAVIAIVLVFMIVSPFAPGSAALPDGTSTW